ncbi:GNAT family N-acetyltransferase [Streptomyces acidiscabies]|uniref:GNAT family N-acetyltransferase n=1 Tax=Streptomyces acidiscabies TaxID=42234 RepID=UPI0038F77EFE
MTITISHHDHHDATDLRPLLLKLYTEIYTAPDFPGGQRAFDSAERFAQGLDGWSSRPGWSCVVGHDGDQAVGFAYGAPLPPDARWWGGLLTDVPPDLTAETGTRTYAFSELMVRTPWRGTGAARQLHDALLADRVEERATLLVDQTHPKVRALYEGWGWHVLGYLRPRIPDAPLFHAMLRPL